jgi:3-phosphoshikimate 1-carboxyvinyltransferase
MEPRRIRRVFDPLDAVLRAPGSKSVTHRALVAAALADGRSEITAPLDADDTRCTLAGIAALGARVEVTRAAWIVDGSPGELPGGGTLALGDSGTSMRLLVALAALGRAASTLDGSRRLRERPIHELVQALDRLGAAVQDTGGALPVRTGGRTPRGGTVRVQADRSSQFASALLLIAPRLEHGLALTLEPPVVSLPYVELTIAVMRDFGVSVERPTPLDFVVRPGRYLARSYAVEGDHSSASYFLAAAAIVGGRVRVEGLVPASRQSDARLGAVLRAAGCEVSVGTDWVQSRGTGTLAAFDLDLGEAPDLAPTLAVLAMFADGRSRLRNIAHLRDKESDRLETIAANVRRLGCRAQVAGDALEIDGQRAGLHGALVETAADHRMAMAFAIAGLAIEGVAIDEPACVSKSNPQFWRQLDTLGGRPADQNW